MICPHCAAPIGEHVTDYGDHACAACGLCGPRDVLEALARKFAFASHVWLEDRVVDLEQQLEAERDRRIEAERLTSESVLNQAEVLLRDRGVYTVTLRQKRDNDGGGVTLRGYDLRKVRSRGTLARAVARLEKERDHG